ncbi:hypothetical protein [Methylobacterium oxalidis]|uniref:hypothetical protein n=1 Tax=Methylobacterium oxalidis TaxID=944322 RepID=UPI00331558E7
MSGSSKPEDVAERFGGPMEPWSGGDGQERLRLALAIAAEADAADEVAAIEAELRRLTGSKDG